MADKDLTFNNVNKPNKAVAKPRPDRINDVDTKNTLYKDIIEATTNGIVDLNSIESLTQVTNTRDSIYKLLDIMAEDPMISSALSIYTSDICEPNSAGSIVWAESDDERVLGMVQHLLTQMSVDKNIYNWAYSLVKYGDLYLRLYRNSEYNSDIFDDLEEENPNTLNEAVILKAYAKDDHYAEYVEMVPNPAEVFELQKFGKSVGYVKTNIPPMTTPNEDLGIGVVMSSLNRYSYNRRDVDVYPATDFVHACLNEGANRQTEEITITTDKDRELSYSVKRGQSVLYNAFKIWRELSMLENSVLLSRLTKSAIVRLVSVEVGDMEKNDIAILLNRVKSMIEQKSALNIDRDYTSYTNPGSIENTIYLPTRDGVGAITTSEIGGQVDVGDLIDLDYFKNKLTGALGIPKQYLGDTDDATGFNGGSSLSLISSQYAKTVKRIQTALCNALTDVINLMLLDKGLTSYINEFTIRMQAPTTQEEKDRMDNVSTAYSNISTVMSLLDDIEDKPTRLEVLKALLSGVTTEPTVLTAIQTEIDKLTAEESESENGDEFGEDEFGGFGDEGGEPDFGGEDLGGGDEDLPQPMEIPDMGGAEESFTTGEGEELLTEEDNDLPSWEDLGVSYTGEELE